MRKFLSISSVWLMLFLLAKAITGRSGDGLGLSQAGAAPLPAFASQRVSNLAPTQSWGRKTYFHGYSVAELATLGGTIGAGFSIDDRGWATGFATLASDATEHATLWNNGRIIDLGTLGGPNSYVNGGVKSNTGDISGASDTAAVDPFQEYFCGTPNRCLGFDWYNGVMYPLPTLGGNNGQAFGNNSLGDIVGAAETTRDPSCEAPQVFDYGAVLWDRRTHRAIQLPSPAGDKATVAQAINDRGDVVGGSGPVCGSISGSLSRHAVLWRNGSPIILPTLRGTERNVAYAINERGQIVGESGLPGDATCHAVLWQNGAITDLGTLPGDIRSAAYGINNLGQIVGTSEDASGNDRPFLWESGTMVDLNSLILSSNLYLLFGFDINDQGVITGNALDMTTGDLPAFEAFPQGVAVGASARRRNVALPAHLRALEIRSRFSRFRDRFPK